MFVGAHTAREVWYPRMRVGYIRSGLCYVELFERRQQLYPRCVKPSLGLKQVFG
jgi:hypothetical protein